MENGRKYVVMGAALTAVLVVIIVGWMLVSHYSYGKEWADYDELYHSEKGTAVFIDDTVTSYYAVCRNDQVYLPVSTVKAVLNDRFYVSSEGILMYTLPDETVEIAPEQRMWTIGGITTKTSWPVCFEKDGVLYVSVEFASMFTDMRYTLYREPDRLMIYQGSGKELRIQVEKDAQVRYLAGRKALILAELQQGDEVCLLATMDDWTKVRTDDGFIGYVPTKALGDYHSVTLENEYIQQDYTNISMTESVCLGWHQVFVTEANAYLTEYLDTAAGVNVVSPTWFALSDEEGGFTSFAEQWYVEEAHSRGVQVWALINDFNKEVDKYELLSRTDSRRALIANLIAAAAEYDLDGINIDFELIDQATGEHFIQFIRELSVECRKAGLVLSIDNYSLVGGRSWYYVEEQGVVADYVIMMGYDEHWSGGTPGSTASITFIEQTIELALKKVPAEKLIHAIPFYTRVWGAEAGVNVSSTAAGMVAAKELLEENNADIKWLDEEGQYFGEYLSDGIMYSIWLEDLSSMKLKLEAVQKADIAGVACWKLGLEEPEVWPLISDYLK